MYKRLLSLIFVLLISVFSAEARIKYFGFAEKGGKAVKTSTTVTYKLMETYPSCLVTVKNAGTSTLATIYSDSIGTVKANPFTANPDSSFFFYIDDGVFDITFSGTGILTPFTRTDISIFGTITNEPDKTLYILDITGVGDITPSPTIFRNSVVKLIGTLSGTRTVVWNSANSVNTIIWNAATGADVFLRSTSEPTGIKVPLNLQSSFINDGTRVYLLGTTGDVNSVLTFDGSAQHVNFGLMWPDQTQTVNYGQMFWEFWFNSGSPSQYLISDGYGGGHAILAGVSGGVDATNHTGFTGNVLTAPASLGTAVSFGAASSEGPAIGEWSHVAFAWNGTYLITYSNGVPLTAVPFTGPRLTFGSSGGGGVAFIAGSDHQNFKGSISQVRAFEGIDPMTPFESDGANIVPMPFVPSVVFSPYFSYINSPALPSHDVLATLVASFLKPLNPIPNLSINIIDPSRARAGIVEKASVLSTSSQYPAPQFIQDPTAPTYNSLIGPTLPAEVIDTPAAIPVGAKVFDSFSRRNQTFAFQTSPTLGDSEGGSLGIKTWTVGTPATNYGSNKLGILRGRAVVLLAGRPVVGFLSGVSAEPDVRVSRFITAGFQSAAVNTGIAFRVQDDKHFCYAATRGITAAGTSVEIGYVNGDNTDNVVATVVMPASWTVLRVVTSGSTVNVYADATLVTTQTVNQFLTATGAGIYYKYAAVGFMPRWDNFTVF